jgi:starch phosphorylase
VTADRPTWWQREHGREGFLVAYFSPEFALDTSLPIYAGGLGILAGDHLHSAHDLGVPLVGVGLFYRRSYFRQSIVDGRQHESYPSTDPAAAGLTLELAPDGRPLLVEVELAGETVSAQIWRSDLRGSPVYLLDTDVEANPGVARAVTDVLYGPDREHRIRQEVLLGVGGARALAALGVRPTVFHLNEGHAAFLALERVRMLVEEEGLAFADALDRVRESTVFTTHTPVPAGNERFDVVLAQRYLADLARRCGVGVGEVLELGSAPGDDGFGLTPLALRTAAYANGVSRLHGEVSRQMWQPLWPETPPKDVPIGHVTNAIHAPTWVAGEMQELLTGAGVRLDGPSGGQGWEKAAALDPEALWSAHARGRRRLLEAVGGGTRGRVGGDGLDPEALTIVFARRFAPYKRATLLFSDPERALALFSDDQRPVQILYAGKSYPTDDRGKALVAEIARIAASPQSRGRVALLEDYDMELGGLLVQGADVWLNNPRRPEEASGTSGMKAALNGALNLSVLDGWWPEAYSPEIGWAIPEDVSARGDEAEAAELLRLLETEVVPAYYERGGDGLPRRWLELMLASISSVGAAFNGARMIEEYVERYYLPAHAAATGARA